MAEQEQSVTDANTEVETENNDLVAKKAQEDAELDQLWDDLVEGKDVGEPKTEEDDEEVASNDEETNEGEESTEKEDGPSKEDLEKENQVVEAIGNKNYIDHDLIKSIEDKELRQKVWNLANTAQSHYNRLHHRDQEINRLKSDLDRMKREFESRPDPATQQQKEQQDKEYSEKIQQFKQDYPDLVDKIDAMANNIFDQKSQQLRELFDKEYGQMRDRYQEESLRTETQRLEEAAKDIFRTEETGVSYRDVVASPDFSDWLETQPAAVKKLAESDNAAEVTSLFKQFEYDYSRKYREMYGRDWVDDVKAARSQSEETHPSANSHNDPTAQAETPTPSKADEVAAKREQTKRKSVTGVKPSRPATTSSMDLEDPDALFDHLAEKSARNRR